MHTIEWLLYSEQLAKCWCTLRRHPQLYQVEGNEKWSTVLEERALETWFWPKTELKREALPTYRSLLEPPNSYLRLSDINCNIILLVGGAFTAWSGNFSAGLVRNLN